MNKVGYSVYAVISFKFTRSSLASFFTDKNLAGLTAQTRRVGKSFVRSRDQSRLQRHAAGADYGNIHPKFPVLHTGIDYYNPAIVDPRG